eukprot:3625282-Pyramimonas_sp.AAC.1
MAPCQGDDASYMSALRATWRHGHYHFRESFSKGGPAARGRHVGNGSSGKLVLKFFAVFGFPEPSKWGGEA